MTCITSPRPGSQPKLCCMALGRICRVEWQGARTNLSVPLSSKTVVNYCVHMRLIGNLTQRGSPTPHVGKNLAHLLLVCSWYTNPLGLTHNPRNRPKSKPAEAPLPPLGDPGAERFGLHLQDKSPCSAFPILAEKVPSYIIKSPVKGP